MKSFTKFLVGIYLLCISFSSVAGIIAPFNPVIPGPIGTTTPSAGAFTTTAVGNSQTLNSSPAAGWQYNGTSGAFYVRTNGLEAYFTAATDNYFGCNTASCKMHYLGGAGVDALDVSSTGINSLLGTTLGAATLTVSTGGLGISKVTADGSAPGAGGAKLQLVCGTNAGSAKLIISAGTSATALTIIDNIGTGVTGC